MIAVVLAQSSTSFNYDASNPFAWIGTVLFTGLGIYCAVDASKYSDDVWKASGQNKVLWQVLPIVIGFCCSCFGLIPSLIYLLSIKKKLDEVQASGAGGYGGYNAAYGGAPGYGAPQGYGQPPAPGGYGQPPGYGTPPAPGGYGQPPAPDYGTPPAPGGYGQPPAPDYGTPPPGPSDYTPPPAPPGEHPPQPPQ